MSGTNNYGADSPTWSPDGATEEAPRPKARAAAGYEDLGLLGVGGMGEVRKVRDPRLDRVVAMKILARPLVNNPDARARFDAEAHTTATLEHPGIVPVHDIGVLEDGRPFFTMKEVRGRTLGQLLKEQGPRDETELRRWIDTFHRVCEAMAYAHSRGVLHRDLKPANVMVGAFGEVLVLDWGIAKQTGTAAGSAPMASGVLIDGPIQDGSGRDHPTFMGATDAGMTRVGAVPGTPDYMSPEQKAGQVDALGPWSDVYALGVILAEILVGKPDPSQVLEPAELAAIVRVCCSPDPQQRPRHAGIVAQRIGDWLEGARRLEQALALVRAAEDASAQAKGLRTRAAELRRTAKDALDALPSWAEIELKRAWWATLDEADAVDREAVRLEVDASRDLRDALARSSLDQAHALLADMLIARHTAAVAAADVVEASRYEAQVREHARTERQHRWIRGLGALTILTDRPCEVDLFRFEARDRLLVPVHAMSLGSSPIRAREIAHGSYVCVLRTEGGEVRYPVVIGRDAHWDGIGPGGEAPIRLPRPGELGPGEVLVPAGWAQIGGDPLAFGPLPERRTWVDAFVIGRMPVAEPEYFAFIQDLEPMLADRLAPRDEPALGDLLWARASGRFSIAGRDPRLPAHGVDWHGAHAYCAWLAAKTGLPYRLPGEVEWEKAARGVDGRFYSCGNHADGAFFCFAGSHRGAPKVQAIDSFPLDESPYGIRGLSGNVRDWTADRYERNGHPQVGGRSVVDTDADPLAMRIQKGGAWSFHEQHARAATRWWQDPRFRHTAAGFRVARPWIADG